MDARRKLRKLLSKRDTDSNETKEWGSRNEQMSVEINHSETARATLYLEHCSKGSNNMFLVESKPVPKSPRHFKWTRPGNERIQN